LDRIIIHSISVRGELGPLTVWVSNVDENGGTSPSFRLSEKHWTKIYKKVHQPSPLEYETLILDEPIILRPGQVRAIYVHSTLAGDEAIVYDNAFVYLPRRGNVDNSLSRKPRYDDPFISIFTGRAHVSDVPFGLMPIWGWGNPWRDHREFVGKLEYGAIYRLWNPEKRNLFGPKFHQGMVELFLCQRRWESPVSKLPDECIYYILNMCRWDWFEDSTKTMHQQLKKRLTQREAETQHQQEAEVVSAMATENVANDDDIQVDEAEAEDEDYDDEDEDYVDMEDDDDDDDSADPYAWERENEYHVNDNVFRFVDLTSDEDHHDEMRSSTRQNWVHRQFARIQIMRALTGEAEEA